MDLSMIPYTMMDAITVLWILTMDPRSQKPKKNLADLLKTLVNVTVGMLVG